MIKVDVVKTKDTTVLHFETRVTTPEGLDELDTVYQALMGSDPKRGGYDGSTKFSIEVKDSE